MTVPGGMGTGDAARASEAASPSPVPVAEVGAAPAESELRAQIGSMGWRQGAVLPADKSIFQAVRMAPFAQFDSLPESRFWLILASQDCDVVCNSLAVEPAVEVLVAFPIAREEERHRQLRHPRELHLTLEGPDGARQPVSLHIRNRGMLDRRLLTKHRPHVDLRIPSSVIDQVSAFLGKRYERVAYPDAFEERFDRGKKALIAVFEKYAGDLQDILLVVRPFEEVGQHGSYTLTVYAVVHDHVADGPSPAYNTLKQEIAAAIRKPLRKLDGIDLEKVTVCGRDEITLREFGRMMPLAYAAG